MSRPSVWRSPWVRAGIVALVLGAYFLFKAQSGPPGDDAIKIVPRNAYVYLHVNLDRGSDQYEKAAKLAAGFPGFPALRATVLGRLAGSSTRSLDFAEDVRPWLGGEAAFALIPSSRGVAGSVIIVETEDRSGATRFLDRIAGTPRTSTYNGVPLRAYERDFFAAFVGDLLVVGQEQPVKRTIDTERGKVSSLDSSSVASEARDPLPEDRVLDAYASAEGVTRLLARQGGLIGQVGLVLSNPALRSAALAVTAGDRGLEIVERSSLDPKLARRGQGLGALPPFKRGLVDEVAQDSLVYLGLKDLYRAFGRFENQVRVNAPPIAAALDRFLRRIRRRGGVDLRRALLPLLRGEAAFWVSPGFPVPVAGLLVDGVDDRKARDAMARLQGPLARSVNTSRSRQAATFKQTRIDGADAFSIRLSPAIDLTYAVFDGKLVIGTGPAAIKQVRSGDRSLEDSELHDATLGKVPGSASSVLFLSLDRLLGLAERTGLGADPGYAEVRDDLRRLKALGATVRSTNDHLEARIALAIQ